MEQNKETPESILAEDQALVERLKAPVFELDNVCNWLLTNTRRANFISGCITSESLRKCRLTGSSLKKEYTIEQVEEYCDIVSDFMDEIFTQSQNVVELSDKIFDIWSAANLGGNHHDK